MMSLSRCYDPLGFTGPSLDFQIRGADNNRLSNYLVIFLFSFLNPQIAGGGAKAPSAPSPLIIKSLRFYGV